MPVTVKAVIDRARAVPGCSGVAVYTGDVLLYSDAVDDGCAGVLIGLLRASPGARRASAAIGACTYAACHAGDYLVLLKVAGRFPALPGFDVEEPMFIDPSCAPALPSRESARSEAEAALRQFGLLH